MGHTHSQSHSHDTTGHLFWLNSVLNSSLLKLKLKWKFTNKQSTITMYPNAPVHPKCHNTRDRVSDSTKYSTRDPHGTSHWTLYSLTGPVSDMFSAVFSACNSRTYTLNQQNICAFEHFDLQMWDQDSQGYLRVHLNQSLNQEPRVCGVWGGVWGGYSQKAGASQMHATCDYEASTEASYKASYKAIVKASVKASVKAIVKASVKAICWIVCWMKCWMIVWMIYCFCGC